MNKSFGSSDSKYLEDPVFQSLLIGCLESIEKGETIDRALLAEQYPEYASELVAFLEDREELSRVASGLSGIEASQIPIVTFEKRLTPQVQVTLVLAK